MCLPCQHQRWQGKHVSHAKRVHLHGCLLFGHVHKEIFRFPHKPENWKRVITAPHVSGTQHAADHNKTIKFYRFTLLGKCTRNTTVHWFESWNEGSLFSGAGWRGGGCVSTNHWPTEVGFGSWVRLLWNRLLSTPLKGVFCFFPHHQLNVWDFRHGHKAVFFPSLLR